MMAFRVGGALESLQLQYFLLNLCFSMVTFDLQAQVCDHSSVEKCALTLHVETLAITVREQVFLVKWDAHLLAQHGTTNTKV